MLKRLFSSISKSPIIVTNSAWNRMTEVIKKHNATSFLFTASSGGCNGFNYELKLLDKDKYEENNNTKIKPIVMEQNNTKLLIDPIAEMLVFGTTIDYISEDFINGTFENKFVFIPDKTFASSCGCGISFTPKI